METTVFFKGKDGAIICKTNFGKISFIDKAYKEKMPKDGEKWKVEILKEFEKFNIIKPYFKISKDSKTQQPPLEKIVASGYYLSLDLFSSEIIVKIDKETFRYPYDGRWDNEEKFFSDYLFPEAIRLHKIAKPVLDTGKSAILVDINGRLVKLSPSRIGKDVARYALFCHILEVDGSEQNYVFINQEAEDKFNKLLDKYKNKVYSGKPLPPDYWNAEKIARAINLPERKEIRIMASSEEGVFAYEDEYIVGEVAVVQTSKRTERIMHVFEVKQKCMIPKFFVIFPAPPKKWWETTSEPPSMTIEDVVLNDTKYDPNFSEAEQYVCGWLPKKYFYQTKEGVPTKKIHKKICGFLADIGEYFINDIPKNKSVVIEILNLMVTEKYIKYLPSDREINSLYPFFQKDWENEDGDEGDFPSEEEWINN